MTEKNEAAERLHRFLNIPIRDEAVVEYHRLIDDALAAERIRAVADHQAECDQKIRDHGDAVRRATVERILERLNVNDSR
jgi:hypothetical protein